MNEVTLHRGRSPHLTTVDSYVDGQHLTEAVVRGTCWHGCAYLMDAERRPHLVHSNRFDRVFIVFRRSYRARERLCLTSHANLPALSLVPALTSPWIIEDHPTSLLPADNAFEANILRSARNLARQLRKSSWTARSRAFCDMRNL